MDTIESKDTAGVQDVSPMLTKASTDTRDVQGMEPMLTKASTDTAEVQDASPMLTKASTDTRDVQGMEPMLKKRNRTNQRQKTLIERLRFPIFREKFFHTVWICWAFIMLGWIESLFGPTFPDLRAIIGENLHTASWLFTATSGGFLVGSVTTGILYERYNKILLLIVSILGAAGATALVPWCRPFHWMLIVKFVGGVLTASLDTGGNSEVVQTWGKGVGPYMQALHFCFALGGMIAPLVAKPFLADIGETLTTNQTNTTVVGDLVNSAEVGLSVPDKDIEINKLEINQIGRYDGNNRTHESILNEYINLTQLNFNNETGEYQQPEFILFETSVHKAYVITAILTALTAIPFGVMYYMKREEKQRKERGEINQDPTNFAEKPLYLKLMILALLSSLTFVYCGTEDTYAGFLMTFCITQLKWSKSSGSIATSIHWISFGFTRLAAIYFVRFIRTSTLLFTFSILMVISFTGLLISSAFNIVPLIWVAIGCSGFSMSVVFPAVFTWTNERVLAVSGRISAMFLTSGSLGIMLIPLLFGYMMERLSPMWFMYLLVGQSILWVILFSITVLLTRYSLKPHSEDADVNVTMEDT